MNRNENRLRTIKFRKPEWIPTKLRVLPAAWRKYGKELESLLNKYPFCKFERTQAGLLSGGFDTFLEKPKNDYESFEPAYRKGYSWGCKWKNPQDGIVGIVAENPVKSRDDFQKYEMPEPTAPGWHGKQNWPQVKRYVSRAKDTGDLVIGTLPHGFLFLRMTYLRGFETLMKDFARNEDLVKQLVAKLVEWNISRIRYWDELGIDILAGGDNLVGQDKLLTTYS